MLIAGVAVFGPTAVEVAAELGRDEPAHAWSVRIFHYENNLMASAARLTESHAMDVVERWDRDVVHAEADPIPIAKAGMLIRPTDAGPSSA